MVTKRTRWLSAISVVLMLVSMLACIFPASAQDVSGMQALLDDLNKYEAKNFTDDANAIISGYKDNVAGAIALYAEADDATYNDPEAGYAAMLAALEAGLEAEIIPAIKNQLTADASPIYSAKDLYEGFTTPEGESFKNYDIATKEDWYAVIADSDNYYDLVATGDTNYTTFEGFTFNFVADIDFGGVMMRPAGANPADPWRANLNGNGHTLSNIYIEFEQYNKLDYGSGAIGFTGNHAGGFISYSKGITAENFVFRNVYLKEVSAVGKEDVNGNVVADNHAYNQAGLFGAPHSAAATYKNIIADVTFDIPLHKCYSSFLGGWGNGTSFTVSNIYFDATYKNVIPGNETTAVMGICQHVKGPNISNVVMVSDSDNAAERALYALRFRPNEAPAIKNIFSAGAPAFNFHENHTSMSDTEKAAEYTKYNGYDAETAAEAIYAFNKAQGDLLEDARCYFDMTPEGVVSFAKGTGNVYKVTVTDQEEESYKYYPVGATATFELAIGGSLKVDGEPIEGNSFEMPAADVAVEIVYSVDGQLVNAKNELTALRDKYAVMEETYVANFADVTAWIASADAALANFASTLDDLNALIASGNALTVTLKEGILIPFSKKATYGSYGEFTSWAISTKEDWIAFVNESIETNGTYNGITLEVTNDIDFGGTEMAPACSQYFEGKINGNGYVFKNLNIVAADGAIAGLLKWNNTDTGEITNLGLASGSVTANGGGNVGSFYGQAWGKTDVILKNCWSALEIKGANGAAVGGLIGRFGGYTDVAAVENCYFIGSFKDTVGGGIIGYGQGNLGQVKNSFAAGTNFNGIDRTHRNAYYEDNGSWDAVNVNAEAGTIKAQSQNSYAVGAPALMVRVEGNGSHTAALEALATLAGYQAYEAKYSLAADAYATGEVAYKVNANADGGYTAIFTNDPIKGTVTLSDGTDGTRKVTLTGDIEKDIYLPAGKDFDLTNVDSHGEYTVTTEGYAEAITGTVLTMPAADITVNVSIDLAAVLEAAKAELQALYDVKSAFEARYINGAEELAAWLVDANAALTGEADLTTVETLIASGKALEISLKNEVGAYAPYSKKDIYATLDANIVNWGISTKEDWIALVNETAVNKIDHKGVTIHVNNDIDFDNVQMLPAYQRTYYRGTVDGHGFVFENVNIVCEVSGKDVGLITWNYGSNTGCVKNLGLASGTLKAKDARYVGSFFGYTWGPITLLENCWSALDISVSGGLSGGVGGMVGRTSDAEVILNSFFIGSVTGASAGGMTFDGGPQIGTIKNSFVAATGVLGVDNTRTAAYYSGGLTGGADATGRFDPQSINTYAVGTAAVHFVDGSENAYAALAELSGYQDYEAKYSLDADAYATGEVAYLINANAEGGFTPIYTNDPEAGTVRFSNGTDATRKVSLTGGFAMDLYLPAGKAYDLANIDDTCTYTVATEGYEDAIAGTVLTMPNADISILVTLEGEEVDQELIDGLNALQAAYNAKVVYNPEYLVNGEAYAAWLAAADAALKAAEPVKADVLALVAEAAELTVAVKEEARIPYADADVYGELEGAVNWTISTKEEWIQLTEDYYNVLCDLNLYITNDIDFENTNMKPLSYREDPDAWVFFTGNIYGQGHTFKNIKIEMAGGGNQYQGVGLVSTLREGSIQDLGLTGNVYNTNAGGGYTAAFVGGYGYVDAVVKNCWTDVHVKGYSDDRGRYLSAFFSGPNLEHEIINCINYGTIESTNTTNGGAASFITYSAQNTLKNSLDLGVLITHGAGIGAAVNSHHNGLHNFLNCNSYSVNTFWGKTHTFNAADVNDAALLPDGSKVTDPAQVDALFAINSIAEGAWKATNGANGAVYYKLDADKQVVFGTATDRVQKITIDGDYSADIYLNVGDTLDLSEYGEVTITVTEGYESALVGTTLTVPNADITVTITEPVCEHSYDNAVWQSDETGHWKNCDLCGEPGEKNEHTGEDDGDCTTAVICECGHEITAAAAEHALGEWLKDDEGHWKECANCDYATEKAGHDAEDDHNCLTAVVCECGHEIVAAHTEHNYEGAEWTTEGAADGYHRKYCVRDNCEGFIEEKIPVLGDAKEDGVINLVDAIAVLRGSVDLDTDVNVANGDVNANGVLDANDAVLIVRFWLNDPAYDGPQLG